MSRGTVLLAAPPLVVKFGGTSVGTPSRVRRAAARVAALRRSGHAIVVVVSAQGKTTDVILSRAARATKAAPAGERPAGRGVAAAPSPIPPRELDRALATGEDLSAALLAAALQSAGIEARSLTGGEAGVEAEGPFGSARIRRVDPEPLLALLARGVVPVVSGFQGRRADGETATLGRGGSDTSAVAIAAALGAAGCEIVTDVPAVYDRDPNVDRRAIPFDRLSYADLRRLAHEGAEVVHPEAARLAESHRVPLRVLAWKTEPLDRTSGTFVGDVEPGGVAAAGGRR